MAVHVCMVALYTHAHFLDRSDELSSVPLHSFSLSCRASFRSHQATWRKERSADLVINQIANAPESQSDVGSGKHSFDAHKTFLRGIETIALIYTFSSNELSNLHILRGCGCKGCPDEMV